MIFYIWYIGVILNSENKEEYYKDILSNISMIDFYLERCLKCKYINNKVCEKMSKDLLDY